MERKSLLLTNDQHAQKEASAHHIEYFDLPLVLRELWKTRIMKREQLLELVAEIRDKDNIVIDNLGLILQ